MNGGSTERWFDRRDLKTILYQLVGAAFTAALAIFLWSRGLEARVNQHQTDIQLLVQSVGSLSNTTTELVQVIRNAKLEGMTVRLDLLAQQVHDVEGRVRTLERGRGTPR